MKTNISPELQAEIDKITAMYDKTVGPVIASVMPTKSRTNTMAQSAEAASLEEKSIVSNWKKLRSSSVYTSKKGSKSKLTAAWYKLGADLCMIAQACQKVIVEFDISPQDNLHPVVSMQSQVRTAFLLSNDGALHDKVISHYSYGRLWEGENDDTAKELVHSLARSGMAYGMLKFDPTRAAEDKEQANALTYTLFWARAHVTRRMQQTARTVTVKTSEDKRQKLKKVIEAFEEQGKQASIEDLMEATGYSKTIVVRLLPHTKDNVMLDTAVGNEEQTTTIGELLSDERSDVLSAVQVKGLVRHVELAISEMENPYHRAVIEMIFGLGGRDVAKQAVLFDGVFVDDQGNSYSAKDSIRQANWRKVDGKVVVKHMDQAKLSEALRKGEMKFVPGTPEAAELCRIMSTPEKPWAPSSGSVQDAQKRGEKILRENPSLISYLQTMRYRGDNVIEQSELAFTQCKQTLVDIGACSAEQARKLKMVGGSGKNPVRMLAEQHHLIDVQTGRFTPKMNKILSGDVSYKEELQEDYESLMSC